MQSKTALITGAGGFIGSHLVEKCVQAGWNVKAFVRYNSSSTWGWLDSSPVVNDIEVIPGDIASFESVKNAAKGCDTIFHLAALIGIPYSFTNPHQYVKTNIEGTYNVLQSALEHQIPNVLITSTSETYGTAQYVPIDELHACHAQSPYAASKIAADQLALSYYNAFGLPVKTVRPFNTFGPRQSARAVIPTIISQLMLGPKVVLGNLTPTRDLLFVEDTAMGFLKIAEAPLAVGQAINLGTGEEISIGDLAHKIARIMNVEMYIENDQNRQRQTNAEVERLVCNNQKIFNLTGWKPQWRLDDGLATTVDWLRLHLNKYKTGKYTV